MPTAKITKRSVDSLRPGDQDIFLWDQEVSGFGLKLTRAGKRTYVLQYRMGGRGHAAKRITIGQHGPLTPDQARAEAKRLLVRVAQGFDPLADRRERQRIEIDLAFDRYAQAFLTMYVREHWKASYELAEAALRLHITPVLKSRPLPAIKRADVTAVIDRIPAKQPALRKNVFAVLRRLMRWALARGDIDINPVEAMETPPGAPSRERVLDDGELKLVWHAAAKLDYPFGPMYLLLMVTGQRREEVSAMRWEELDRGAQTWRLPGERSKNGHGHTIHLSLMALTLLDDLSRLSGGTAELWPKTGFVFTTTGRSAVSGYSRAKRRIDAMIQSMAESGIGDAGIEPDPSFKMSPWRIHDIRRTMATVMQRLGVRFEVIEACENRLSGLSRTGVAGRYQRYDWAAEKKWALDLWAGHLDALVTPKTGTAPQ